MHKLVNICRYKKLMKFTKKPKVKVIVTYYNFIEKKYKHLYKSPQEIFLANYKKHLDYLKKKTSRISYTFTKNNKKKRTKKKNNKKQLGIKTCTYKKPMEF